MTNYPARAAAILDEPDKLKQADLLFELVMDVRDDQHKRTLELIDAMGERVVESH